MLGSSGWRWIALLAERRWCIGTCTLVCTDLCRNVSVWQQFLGWWCLSIPLFMTHDLLNSDVGTVKQMLHCSEILSWTHDFGIDMLCCLSYRNDDDNTTNSNLWKNRHILLTKKCTCLNDILWIVTLHSVCFKHKAIVWLQKTYVYPPFSAPVLFPVEGFVYFT